MANVNVDKENRFFVSPQFKRWYIYNEKAITEMLMNTRNDPELLAKVLEDTGFGFSSPSGSLLSSLDSQDKYGHSGYSMAQTVFATQKIIREGVDSFRDELLAKNAIHPIG